MTPIKEGDRVRHKTASVNGGLGMSVLEVNQNKALCDHFAGAEGTNIQTWFDISDLRVTKYGDGGFKKEGE